MRKSSIFVVVALFAVAALACAPAEEEVAPVVEEIGVEPEAAPVVAVAVLQPREDKQVSGTVTFTQRGGLVEVAAEVVGVEGPGLRGFHLHEHGDCSAADFTSAGDHFDPHGGHHGPPSDPEGHAGDFGNIEIREDGSGSLVLLTDQLTVEPGPASVVGRAVILHEQADDLETQPTGDAGGRVACGVVELAATTGHLDADRSRASS